MTNRQSVMVTTQLVGQVILGGVVSCNVTVWVQVVLLPQPSLICQVSVITFGQTPLVTGVDAITSKLVKTPLVAIRLVQQLVAVGVSKLQISPHSTVLLPGHRTCKQLVGQQPRTMTV